MSKISLIAAMALGGLVAFSTLATAQDASSSDHKGRKGGMSVEQRMEKLSTELSLTDDQKPKVKAVLEDTAQKMKDLAPEDRRTKGREIMDDQNKKMKEILTADQFKKYEEMMQNMRGKKGGKHKKSE